MARLEFHHIAWSKDQPPRHRFDLADSAVATPDLEALGLPGHVPLPRDGYLEVLPALERALATRYAAPGGRVLVAAGASEANAIVYAALLGPGDEALVETPGYDPHRGLARMFGATLTTFERPRDRDYGGFGPALEAALRPATRLVVVSNLHNPSGVALTDADLSALDRLSERHGFQVLADETYLDASGPPRPTLAGRGPRWITTSSITKSYGLGGLRIGWIAAGAETLERCAAAQNGLSGNPALPSVALALALVPHLDRLLECGHRLLATNHALWNARVASRLPAIEGFDPGPTPRGTTAFMRFPGERAGDAFVDHASREHELAVTPGRFFGDPRGVRIGLGTEPERFAQSLARLERALAGFTVPSARSGATA